MHISAVEDLKCSWLDVLLLLKACRVWAECIRPCPRLLGGQRTHLAMQRCCGCLSEAPSTGCLFVLACYRALFVDLCGSELEPCAGASVASALRSKGKTHETISLDGQRAATLSGTFLICDKNQSSVTK